MSQYQAIKTATNAYIRTNGRQEITGAILNAVMIATIDSLGKYYQFVGYATPDTNPGIVDQNIAYLAGTPGVYTFLGGYTINPGEVAVIKFDGEWKKEVVIIIPSKVSQLENDLGFITNAVSDLVNYYTKADTFSKTEVQNILGNYYDRDEVDSLVSAIVQQSYVVSWDGTAEPVVADIPAGVSVTWGGNPYVGTLPASADTANKIYLVSNGAGYDEYITTDNNGYSWIPIGTTSIDLSGYVDNATFNALASDVSDLDDDINGYDETIETLIPQTLDPDHYYNMNNNPPSRGTSSTGTYCLKVAVSPGQVYRITGVGSTSASRLWAITESDGTRKSTSAGNVNARTTPVDLTIPVDGAYLYVNLTTYDSATDKVERVETSTIHHDGLEQRVTALESSSLAVIDSLDSTSTTEPLSANQGRVLNEDINGETSASYIDQEVIPLKYFNTENSRVPAKSNLANATSTYCVYLDVTPGEVYRIYGKGNSGSTQLYAMADADRYVVEGGTPGIALNTRTTPLDLTIPSGVAILVVNLYQYDSDTDKVQKVVSVTSECVKTRLTALEGDMILALPLTGKKVMFFGDSVTAFTYGGKGLVDYFAQASRATCYKAAIGGSRLSQRATPVETPTTETEARAALDICNMVKAWCEQDYTKQDAATAYLDDYTARVNALKNNPISGVDIVFFASGGNDLSAGVPFGNDDDTSLTTINGAINEIISMLLTANSALKIYVYSPVVNYRNNTRDDAHWSDNWLYPSYGKTKPELIELIEKRVKAWHIPYINLYWDLGWNQLNFSTYYLSTDGTHPYKGFDVLGRRIYQRVVSLIQ